MGDPACWLGQVCEVCGRFDDDLDADGRCRRCVAVASDGTADDTDAGDDAGV